MEPVSVECYSGHTYAQEPRAIIRRGARVSVVSILRAWRTPDGPAFRVCLDDGTLIEIHYSEPRDEWRLSPLKD